MAPIYYPLAAGAFSETGFDEAVNARTVASIQLACEFESTRYPPTAIFDPFETGAASFLEKIFQQKHSPVSVKVLPDAIVFSQRMALAQGTIHSDYQLDPKDMHAYIAGVSDINPRDHRLLSLDGMFASELLDQIPQRLLGTTALLTSAEPVNFGAWLIRTLPKIAYLSDLLNLSTINILCFCDRPWQIALLEWMGIKRGQIISQQFIRTYKAEVLIVPSWPNRAKTLDVRTLAMLNSFRIKAAANLVGRVTPKAIYVSRLNWRLSSNAIYRPFPQEKEFEGELIKIGFTPVSPENMNLAEAVHLFANADIVVGAQGAGMFNSIFCRPGTKIIEIHHLRSFLHGHPSMYASCGLDYSIVLGKLVDSNATMMQQAVEIDLQGTIDFVKDSMN